MHTGNVEVSDSIKMNLIVAVWLLTASLLMAATYKSSLLSMLVAPYVSNCFKEKN